MHNPFMGERPPRPCRVLIEDARRNGEHLQVTWHPERRQFVVSTWRDDVCTGTARLAVEDVADLAALLVDGLTEAAAAPAAATTAAPPARPGLPGLVDRLRWLVRGPPPGTPAGGRRTGTGPHGLAPVRPLRRHSA